MLRVAHKHPQACWNRYPLLIEALGFLSMDFIIGLPSYANGCNAIFTSVDRLTKYTVLNACTLGEGELSAKQVAQLFF